MPANYGLFEISSDDQAKDAWESFFGRFFSPEIPPGVDVTFNSDLRKFMPRDKKDAKYKHSRFRNAETSGLPLDTDKTLHSDDFDDFLNGNTVTIPKHITLTEEGLNRVEKAIEEGNYEDQALKNEDHTFYALWLFKQNKITRQQMTTILARAQIPKEYPLVKTFHIFDDNQKLSQEAVQVLFPAIAESWFGNDYSEEILKRFLLLLAAAPKSEQIFFISKANPGIVSATSYQLGNALYVNRAWHRATYQGEEYDLHFSFGLIEALQIAKHGVQGAAASRSKLGKVGIDAVKEGVEFNFRPTAISMPDSGVEATTKGIHEYAESPMPAVTGHDVFHSKLHNTIPPEFHMMLNHMNQVISKHTKQKWSKTLWELVDREFHAFQLRKINLNSNNGAMLFMGMLHGKNRDPSFLFRQYSPPQLSDEGFAVVWNMVNNPDVWKNLYKIDINQLGFPYNSIIERMVSFKQAVGSEHKHPEILALKYSFFNVSPKNEFQTICKLLDVYGDDLVTDQTEKNIPNNQQKLVFGKYTQGSNKNVTTLKFKKFGKEMLINEDNVKQLIPIVVTMHLDSLFGATDTKAVSDKVNEISSEFKSTYNKSKLSKETLQRSLSSLPSIASKLDFLEACYEEIIHSKNYTRRHNFMDMLFTFFKNPLTSSQRTHITLLKEKLNEVIREYQEQQHLDKESIDELQWLMKNRGSNLYRCNTEQFYVHLDSAVPSARMY